MITGPGRRTGEVPEGTSQGRKLSHVRQRMLTLRNRQRVRQVDLRVLRQVVQEMVQETWREGSYDLAVYFVAAPEMTRLNETFLEHKGSTDVITFDYTEEVGRTSLRSGSGARMGRANGGRDACASFLHGEIFVCLDEAVSQAGRFHTTWQSEVVRYVVHGVLHLLGYDDLDTRARRKMKKAEDALVSRLARQFDLHDLSRPGAGSRA
jgi:rRNA maturation RNase YbeY